LQSNSAEFAVLGVGRGRAKFVAMDGRSTARAVPGRFELGYSGRQVDHVELLRGSEWR
jgi:hypothetical protein